MLSQQVGQCVYLYLRLLSRHLGLAEANPYAAAGGRCLVDWFIRDLILVLAATVLLLWDS